MDATRSICSPSASSLWLHSSHHRGESNSIKFLLINSSSLSPPSAIPTKHSNSSHDNTFSLLYKKNPHIIHKQIQRLARHNNLSEAVFLSDSLQHLGIPVNPTTFAALISACIRSKSPDHAKQIHALIQANGLGRNEYLRIKVIQMYASCGCYLENAQSESLDLSSSGASNVYQWNALLRGTVVSGNRRCHGLVSFYSEMRESGVELNEYTFSCLLKGFAGAREFRQGLKAHGLLVKNGWIGSSVLQTCLIDMYFKCRKPRLAHHVFDEMPLHTRDIVAWGAMIAGLAHNGLQREAVEFHRMMVEQGIAPNSVGLTTILPAIGELGERNVGKAIHAYVLKEARYSEQFFIQSALIDMYCKCGDIMSARRAFNAGGSNTSRNLVCWTALISGYISNGRLEQALRLLIWMQQEGLRPDVVTLATVLPVCAQLRAELRGRSVHAYILRNGIWLNVSLSTSLMAMYAKCGRVEYCCRLFDQMERPNVITWTVLIDSLREHALLKEAIHAFRRMLVLHQQKPDAVLIAKVLGVCSELEVLKHGKQIHAHVLKKKWERVPFVSAQLSNMYANCKEVEKAQQVLQ